MRSGKCCVFFPHQPTELVAIRVGRESFAHRGYLIATSTPLLLLFGPDLRLKIEIFRVICDDDSGGEGGGADGR